MATILIFSNNPYLAAHWSHALIGEHSVSMLTGSRNELAADAVVIDAKKLDEDPELYEVLANQTARFLIVGPSDWPEDKQISYLLRGAAGYCYESEPEELVKRAISSIIAGDIWIKRSLVPKVIGALTNHRPLNNHNGRSQNLDEQIKNFDTLSSRELEVAEMIQVGENNKRIALVLNISERTVKAHLSSIFRKLNVDDRLHLAILLKEIEQHRKAVI